MSEKPLRKRKYPSFDSDRSEIIDPQEYKKNCVSKNAKRIKTESEKILYEIWHDKHYYDRHQFGDENGKREGIDPDAVHNLLKKAMPYLILCGVSHLGFRFINHSGNSDTVKVVLQTQTPNGMLNVVIWSHMIDPTFYEITVKTALVVDDFRMDFGQCALEVSENEVILKKMADRRVLQEISKFTLAH